MAPPAKIDALFQLPLSEYAAARNALAASLKAAGRAADAAAVRALPKPTLSAWTVNQLCWKHRVAFNQLMAAGTRLRKAHAAKLEGGKSDLRAATTAHAAALGKLTTGAANVLRDAGHVPTLALTHRIATTLVALASLERHSLGRDGHLTGDIDLTGFEALAVLVPRQGGSLRGTGQSRVIPFRRRAAPSHAKQERTAGTPREDQAPPHARRKAAARTLRDADHAVRAARQAADRAETALRTAAGHVKVTEKAKAALTKQLEEVSADADTARQDARRIAVTAEEAAQAIADAERAQAEARRALDSLR
jgi:hypothetical protein